MPTTRSPAFTNTALSRPVPQPSSSTGAVPACSATRPSQRSSHGSVLAPGAGMLADVWIANAQAREDFDLARFHFLGIRLAGFVVPALRMQRAMNQQVRVVRGQGLALFLGFAR